MKNTLSIAILCLLATSGTRAAVIIDDFSIDSSGKYNTVHISGSQAAYGIADDQFAPTWSGEHTIWLRNDGYTFDIGSSVLINVCAVPNLWQAAGLGLNRSLTVPDAEADAKQYFIQNQTGGVMKWQGKEELTDLSFTKGPATISLTRTSGTGLDYAVHYFKTDGSAAQLTGTDTIASGAQYFGMWAYSCGGARWDNLAVAPVPEPAALVVLLGGVTGLMMRRRR